MEATDKAYTDSLKLLGDFWTLRIIGALNEHAQRFCDLQRDIDNCNPVTLTNRLKRLEEAGLIHREAAIDDSHCVTYSLTKRGHQAVPVVAAIDSFASRARITTV